MTRFSLQSFSLLEFERKTKKKKKKNQLIQVTMASKREGKLQKPEADSLC